MKDQLILEPIMRRRSKLQRLADMCTKGLTIFTKAFLFVFFSILFSLLIFKIIDIYTFTSHTQIEATKNIGFYDRMVAFSYFSKLNKQATQPKTKSSPRNGDIYVTTSSNINRLILLDGHTATIITNNYISIETRNNTSYIRKISCTYTIVAKFKLMPEVGWAIPEIYAVKKKFNSINCQVLYLLAGEILNGQTTIQKQNKTNIR